MNDKWLSFIHGDDDAFGQIYKHFRSELYAYGLKLGFDEDVCKDAIQDVFIKVFDSRKKLKHVEQIEFYLLRSMKNRLIDIYKEKKTNNELDESIKTYENEGLLEKLIEREAEEEIEQRVKNLLNKLTPRQREAIHCRYILNMKYNEIAVVMDISPESVKDLLQRGMKTLKNGSDNLTDFLFVLLCLLIVKIY